MTEQTVTTEVLKRYHEALTDLIYDYLCYFRKDKTTLPRTDIVKIIRDKSMEFTHHILNNAVEIEKETIGMKQKDTYGCDKCFKNLGCMIEEAIEGKKSILCYECHPTAIASFMSPKEIFNKIFHYKEK